MLDRFIVGDVTRISPEAPVPVVRFQSEYVRLGGAANVAHNLAALGARVSLVGVVGATWPPTGLRDQLAASGIGVEGLVGRSRSADGREGPHRHRAQPAGGAHRLRERQRSDGAVEEQVVGCDSTRSAADADVLLVSDYLKGDHHTRRHARALTAQSRRRRCSSIPKIPHLDRYAGATLMTPNHHEAEFATHRRIRTDDGRARSGRRIPGAARTAKACSSPAASTACGCRARKADGTIPSVAREVSDVTGAGDTVVATWRWRSPPARRLVEAGDPRQPRRRHRGRQIRTRDDHRRRTARSVHDLQLGAAELGASTSATSRRSSTLNDERRGEGRGPAASAEERRPPPDLSVENAASR